MEKTDMAGGAPASLSSTDPEHHCLICDATTKKLAKEENYKTCARTLTALTLYPDYVKKYLLTLCSGDLGLAYARSSASEAQSASDHQLLQQFENSVFCADCAKRLRAVHLVFMKMMELQKKVDRFQREVGRDLRRCVKIPSLQTEVRERMVLGLKSCFKTEASLPLPLRECSVRLIRVDQQFGNTKNTGALIPVDLELIKQEIVEMGMGEGTPMFCIESVEAVEADESGDDLNFCQNEASGSDDYDYAPSSSAKDQKQKKMNKKEPKFPFTETKVDPNQLPNFKCRYPKCGYVHKGGRLGPAGVNIHVQAYHPKGPGELPLVCGKCGECFATEEKRDEHLQLHAASEVQTQITFQCLHCPSTFRGYRRFREHSRDKHPEQRLPTTRDFPGLEIKTGTGTKPLPFTTPKTCWHCPRQFQTFNAIYLHCCHKHPGKRRPRIRDFPEIAPPKAEAAPPGAALNSCPHCGFTCIENPKKLEAHIKRHVKKFRCQVENCDASFNERDVLRRHQTRYHPELGLPLLKCLLCDAQYNRVSGLEYHMRAKHSQTPPLVCHYEGCDFQTPHPRRMKFHIERVHLRKKNHLCTDCGKSFYFRKTFTEHRRTTHTGIKPYMCGICGKQFSRKGVGKIHEKTHGPVEELLFVCELCGFRYPTKTNLVSHVKSWHHGGVERIGVQPKKKGKYNQEFS